MYPCLCIHGRGNSRKQNSEYMLTLKKKLRAQRVEGYHHKPSLLNLITAQVEVSFNFFPQYQPRDEFFAS